MGRKNKVERPIFSTKEDVQATLRGARARTGSGSPHRTHSAAEVGSAATCRMPLSVPFPVFPKPSLPRDVREGSAASQACAHSKETCENSEP